MFEVGGTRYQNQVWTYIPLDKKRYYLIAARALSGQAFWFPLWIISELFLNKTMLFVFHIQR